MVWYIRYQVTSTSTVSSIMTSFALVATHRDNFCSALDAYPPGVVIAKLVSHPPDVINVKLVSRPPDSKNKVYSEVNSEPLFGGYFSGRHPEQGQNAVARYWGLVLRPKKQFPSLDSSSYKAL